MPEALGIEAPADWASLRSPENYAGYERTENFASPGDLVPGRPQSHRAPVQLRLNHWALSGDWTAGRRGRHGGHGRRRSPAASRPGT